MRISRKASYGLSALAALTRHPRGCSVHVLAQEEHLPEDYLEKILQHLKRSGFVVSEKGAHGGYTLAKPPQEITSWDIIETLDGGFKEALHPAFSGILSPCPVMTHCQTKSVWEQLESTIKNTLSRVTLADLVPKEARTKQSA
ncbi:MAG: Rrf2 family transcriptional regulator [Candidatus Moraniibacteriota bacterium]